MIGTGTRATGVGILDALTGTRHLKGARIRTEDRTETTHGRNATERTRPSAWTATGIMAKRGDALTGTAIITRTGTMIGTDPAVETGTMIGTDPAVETGDALIGTDPAVETGDALIGTDPAVETGDALIGTDPVVGMRSTRTGTETGVGMETVMNGARDVLTPVDGDTMLTDAVTRGVVARTCRWSRDLWSRSRRVSAL